MILILRNHPHWQEITSNLLRILLILLFVFSKTTKVLAQDANIGDISELRGNAQIVRDEPLDAFVDFDIQSNDEAITSNGRMAITFLDESVVTLTEHSKLVVNEYVYDPDPSKSKMSINFALGTARFLSGNVDRLAKQNINLTTPTAVISLRGTSASFTVNELGETLVINLPYGEFGTEIGEIEVITATGSVILNKPFEATTVSVFENAPSKPVVLDLSLDLIDNILIVSPPEEKVLEQEEVITQSKSILDFNDLDIDYLEEDFLDNESELEFTELDINYLDVNFLEDLLDILDELEIQEEQDQLQADVGAVQLSGTQFGQDLDTQITTFITGEKLTVLRSVNSTARIDIDSDDSYTVIIIQDGVSRTIQINGGNSSVIRIRQEN